MVLINTLGTIKVLLDRKSSGKTYDPTGLDFRASISAAAQLLSKTNDVGHLFSTSKKFV